jgi:hypothetical protein
MTLIDESNCVVDGYYLYERYLFQDSKLYVLKTSVHDFLVWEILAKRSFRTLWKK